MKKSTAAKIISICIIAVGVACLLLMVLAPQISAITNPPLIIRMPSESLTLNVQGVSENNGYCNVSFSILNTSPSSVTLDKIQMHGAIVVTFINGTEIIDPSQMSYGLKSDDTLQVNLIAPIANYTPNATVPIAVYTPQAMYYAEAILP